MIDPIDLRTFPPVEPLSVVPDSYRQTVLAKSVECPRSAYLYYKYGGGALTHPLAGGTLLHRTIERLILHAVREGETTIPPEIAKDTLNEMLVESTDLTVSPDRFDSLRAMIFHLAEGFALDPAKVVCIETPVEVEVGGRRVTGTIDFAEADDFSLTVIDWKSAFYNAARPELDGEEEEYVPSKDDWPGTFQLVLYAYALATGRIHGAPEGFNFSETWEFRLKQIHPRQFWENEGTMAYREAVITREALLDWRLYLEAVVAALDKAFTTWEFPAIIGHHCDYCPASAECPIPAPLRDWRGEIRTEEDAKRAATRRFRHLQIADQLFEGIKGWAKNSGRSLRYGRDQELRWKKSESERLKDKVEWPIGSGDKMKGREALKAAVVETELHGKPLKWDHFFTKSVSTRYTKRTLKPKELAEEAEQNGGK